MAIAQLLKVAHIIDNNVTEANESVKRGDENVLVVKSGAQIVNDNIKAIDDNMQTMADGGQSVSCTIWVISDSHHAIDGMATAKDVKIIFRQTMDGVQNVKLVNDNGKVVDDRVQIMADGLHRLFCASVASSLIITIQTARQPPRK